MRSRLGPTGSHNSTQLFKLFLTIETVWCEDDEAETANSESASKSMKISTEFASSSNALDDWCTSKHRQEYTKGSKSET
jgi:hypothetical protein